MSNGLGLVNTKLSVEDNLQILRDNGVEVSKKLLNIGATVLKEKSSRSAQSTSSTTYIALAEWQVGVKCSGGIVLAMLETHLSVNGNRATFQLLVDDESKKEANYGCGVISLTNFNMTWIGSLNKGNHTFKYKVKSDGGNIDIGNTAFDSTLYIVEFNNGG